MKLDDLISKYLDGELSYDEDIHLRNLLKNNPDAKADFDSAVLINSAIREDAQSIQAPQDFLKNTEDLVLMRILSANEPSTVQKEKRKFVLWLPGLSFMFALLLIGTLYFVTNNSDTESFSDSRVLSLNNSVSEQKQINPKTIEALPVSEKPYASKTSKNLISVPSFSKSQGSQISSMLSKEKSLTSANVADRSTPSNASISNLVEQSADYSSIDNETDSFSERIDNSNNQEFIASAEASPFAMFKSQLNSSTLLNSNKQIKLNPINNINLSFLENFTTPVILSTLYTTNSINKNSKTISSLSQSIAYNCTNDLALGIEFGFTEYNYDRTAMIKVPFTGGSLDSKVEIGNHPDQSGDFVYVPINLAQNYKQYWVSTFIDIDALDFERVSINTRIGAGLSGNGAMFYSRLLSDIELFNGVYLKFGGEVKSFEGLVLNAKTKYITTGSLIYGIKLKLY
ncbi:MAG: hypothetical protein N3A67_06540 [Ignavibacteria bacterium]|nr:hypothetical protein [Ignavibacteria bacterium]